jgi:CHAD domain-containing protein
MSMIHTFSYPDVAAAVNRLEALGFRVDSARALTRTMLDTFDGSLHRAGVCLVSHRTDSLELVLSGETTLDARLALDSLPRFATDIAPGPFRERLVALVGVRALLPLVTVTGDARSAALVNRDGKLVVAAVIYDRPRNGDGVALADCIVEVEELVGYRRHAALVTEQVAAVGVGRTGADLIALAAHRSRVDPRGFVSSPTVPLDSSTPAYDGFRAVLANLADSASANWQGSVDDVDTEFLHDLRIAVRRTRTVIREGRAVLPSTIGEEAREQFGRLGRLTGPVRDLDVFLLEWPTLTADLDVSSRTALEPLRAMAERQRSKAFAEMTALLALPEIAGIVPSWQEWLRDETRGVETQGRSEHADTPLGIVVARRVRKAHTVLLEAGRLIQSNTPADQVHDLRKDAKRLRYLIECFGSLVPDGRRKAFVSLLKTLQSVLGEHQDAEIQVARLRTFASEFHTGGGSSDTTLAIGQLIERVDERRRRARHAFADRFAGYDSNATAEALDDVLHAISQGSGKAKRIG